MIENVNVIIMDMEYGIHEHLIQNHDGSYSILLNARDTRETREVSFAHALYHIVNGDFEKDNVQQIEADAHKKEGKYEGIAIQDYGDVAL